MTLLEAFRREIYLNIYFQWPYNIFKCANILIHVPPRDEYVHDTSKVEYHPINLEFSTSALPEFQLATGLIKHRSDIYHEGG